MTTPDPTGEQQARPAAADLPASDPASGPRRGTRAPVVPLVHPPPTDPPVRRVPPRWDDTLRVDARPATGLDAEDGSLVTEYGLVAVLGATIVGLAVRWASDGAITELLGALLARVRELVGA